MPGISATITAAESRTRDIRVLTLQPQAPVAYEAGQYIDVSAKGFEARPFSIANPPRRDGTMTLHVRDIGTGLGNFLGNTAQAGDSVTIEAVKGGMHAHAAIGRPVFMIGGGTGVVPLLSIAEEIVRKGITEEGMTLIYGVRMESDIHCGPELEILQASGELSVHTAIGTQTPDVALKALAPDLSGAAVYISGPDPMLWGVYPVLKALGMQESRLHTDADLKILAGLTG